MKKKYNHSEAEQRFYDYISKEYPDFKATKKGFPDFMLIKNQNVVGFVEVKRSDLGDNLTKEQMIFKNFCKEKRIPYQVWSPIMTTKIWKSDKGLMGSKQRHNIFKQMMMYADSSVFEQLESINKEVSPINNDTKNNFYTTQELAEKLRVNIMTIYRYIKAGKLKAYKIGKEFRIEKKEFNKFLDKAKTK